MSFRILPHRLSFKTSQQAVQGKLEISAKERPSVIKKKRYAHARKNLSVTNKRVRKESSSAHFVCIRRHANRHRLETMPLDKVLQVVLDT